MRKPMDDPNTTTGTLEDADEDNLTYTASDEALEAAAGIGVTTVSLYWDPPACIPQVLRLTR
jgi:hypothetical protein